ncbi:MAG TPA: hypothetical protein PLK12_03670 [Prolixibacteraceae bacterium]|nr:hypothetical protein [Prolixibacteraceae bacterium]
MKQITFLLSFVFFFFSQTLVAQITLEIIPPPPNELNMETFNQSIIITNEGNDVVPVFLIVRVDEATDGQIVEGTTSVMEVAPGAMYASEETITMFQATYHPAYESGFFRSGNAPSGNYTVCVQAFDATSEQELDRKCIRQEVALPHPPILVFPPNGETIKEDMPIFTWTPPVPTTASAEVMYKIVINETFDYQTPEEALTSSPVWFTENELYETTFVYPLAAREFEPNKQYVWAVQSLSPDGFPIGENNGWSEVYSFLASPGNEEEQPLVFLIPAEGESIGQKPVFAWIPLPIEGVRYTLYFWLKDPEIHIGNTKDKPSEIDTDKRIIDTGDLSSFTIAEENENRTEPFFVSETTEDPRYTYPESAPLLENGQTLFYQVRATIPDAFSDRYAHSNQSAVRKNFVDENLEEMGCDSARMRAVNVQIELELTAVKQNLCSIQGDIDGLKNKLSMLDSLQNLRDSLQGELETAQGFYDTLEKMKNTAVNHLQEEIDEINMLTPDACFGNWRTSFRNRSNLSPSAFNYYASKTEKMVENCKNRSVHNLEEKKKDLERDANKQYFGVMEDVATIIAQKKNEVDRLNNEIENAKNAIGTMAGNITLSLQSVQPAWEAIIRYSTDNWYCVKCEPPHPLIPDQVAAMDQCLDAILQKLGQLKNVVGSHHAGEDPSADAFRYFNPEPAKKWIDEINQLRSQLKNMPPQPGTQMVPACCEAIFVRLSQHYLYNNTVLLYGSHNNPRVSEAQRYGLYGMNRIVVPSDPLAYRNGRDARDNYRDARDAFQKEVREKRSELNALIKQMEKGGSPGSSGGKKNIVKGFSDPRSIALHGRIKANELRPRSNNELNRFIDSLAQALSRQYTQQQLANSRIELGEIRTRCATFKLCLSEAGGLLGDRDTRRDAIRNNMEQLRNLLNNKINALNGRIEQAKRSLEELNSQISDLEEEVRNLVSEASVNNSILNPGMKQEIINRIRQARQDLQSLQRDQQLFRGRINALENKRQQAQQRATALQSHIDQFNNNHQTNGPTTIQTIGECERLKRSLNAELNQMEQEQQNREQQANDAANDAQSAINDTAPLENEIGDASARASGAIRRASGINSRFDDEVAKQTRINEEAQKREDERKRRACIEQCKKYSQQILDEQKDAMKDELRAQMVQLLDKGMEYAQNELEGQLSEMENKCKNEIQDALSILRNMANTENMRPTERLHALSEIMGKASSLLNDASNTASLAGGTLATSLSAYAAGIGVYAKLATIFADALTELEQLLNKKKAGIINTTLDHQLSQFDQCLCRRENSINSYPNINDFLEAEWERISPQQLFEIVGTTVSNDEEKKEIIGIVRSYYFTEAKARLLKCCLQQSVDAYEQRLEAALKEMEETE